MILGQTQSDNTFNLTVQAYSAPTQQSVTLSVNRESKLFFGKQNIIFFYYYVQYISLRNIQFWRAFRI